LNRDLVLIIPVIFASGSIITLISGFYKHDLSQGLGVSITGFGFPLSWYNKIVIVYPGEPTHYEFSLKYFILDISFWSLVATLLTVIVYRRNIPHSQKKETLQQKDKTAF